MPSTAARRGPAAAVAAAAADPDAWVVVVTGEGRAFSSGMDRRALSAGAVGEPFFRDWIRALNGLEDMGKLAVAAIRGDRLGGGLQLALACDLRRWRGRRGAGAGGDPPWADPRRSSAPSRPRRRTRDWAKELALLNDQLTPQQSQAMGLVNWVVPVETFDAELRRVIDKCLAAAPTASRHTKRLLLASFHNDPRTLVDDVVAAQMECMRGWELAEANRAWDERREARFFPPPNV